MKERPILYRGEMVQAIQEDRKTLTRRIVKAKNRIVKSSEDGQWYDADGINPGVLLKCPYGEKGSKLWVKETFLLRNRGQTVVYKTDMDPVEAAGFGAMYGGWKPSIFMPRWASRITLEILSVRVERLQDISEEDAKAEGVHVGQRAALDLHQKRCNTCGKHKNLHIGSLDACPQGYGTVFSRDSYKGGFKWLWQSINGPESWDANPYVWRIEFKKVVT